MAMLKGFPPSNNILCIRDYFLPPDLTKEQREELITQMERGEIKVTWKELKGSREQDQTVQHLRRH